MIQKAGYLKYVALLLFIVAACSRQATSPTFTDYDSFVSSYTKQTETVAEVYGKYSARQSGKTARARFNLLLEPGKKAYMEILDPSDRLQNALSLTPDAISLLWAKDGTYVKEPPTVENLKAIIGLPVNSDDALQLISGQGLQFSAWEQTEIMDGGWKLSRGPAMANVVVREHLSELQILTKQGSFQTLYDRYEMMNNKSVPTRIRFQLPERNVQLELQIEKYEPRMEQPSPDLFEVKLPPDAQRVSLKEIYKGKPLLIE